MKRLSAKTKLLVAFGFGILLAAAALAFQGQNFPGASILISALSGAIQGQPVMGAATGGAPSALFLDANQFPGTSTGDICDKIAQTASFAATYNIGNIDARAIVGAQSCTPITANATFSTWPGNGAVGAQLYLGNTTITLGTNTSVTTIVNCTVTAAGPHALTVNTNGGNFGPGAVVSFSNMATGCTSLNGTSWTATAGTSGTTIVVATTNLANIGLSTDNGAVSALGTPAWTIPNHSKIYATGQAASVIKADNTGTNCSNGAFTCTNFGVRQYGVAAVALTGSGSQCPGTTCWTSFKTGATIVNCTIAGGSHTLTVNTVSGAFTVGANVTFSGMTTNCTALNGQTFTTTAGTSGTVIVVASTSLTNAALATDSGTAAFDMTPVPAVNELMQVRTQTTGVTDANWGMYVACRTQTTNNGGCQTNPTSSTVDAYIATAVSGSNGGSIIFGTPLVALARSTALETLAATLVDANHIQLYNVNMDCNGVTGCISFQNTATEEQSIMFGINAKNSPFAGFDLHSGGASGGSNSGPYIGINVSSQSYCDFNTIGAYFGNTFYRSVDGATVTLAPCAFSVAAGTEPPASVCGGAACASPRQAVLYDATSGGNALRQFHIEGTIIGIEIGANFPTQGVLIDGFLGHNTVAVCIDISNNFQKTGNNQTGDITINRIAKGINGCTTDVGTIAHATINDHIQGIVDTDTVTGTYTWDSVASTGFTNLVTTSTSGQTRLDSGIKVGSLVASPNCLLGGATGTASPAACTSAWTGKIAVPSTGGTSYVVNTTVVTANSQIFVQQTTDNSGLPNSPTCNTNAEIPSVLQNTRVAATSFTLTGLSNPAAITCFQYWITN